MDAAIEQYTLDETRGDTADVSLTLPYPLHPSCVHMQVKSGSKTKNLVPFVLKKMYPTDGNVIPIEQVTWNAFGDGISKAIACAEMTKRKSSVNLFQYVQIGYKTVEHFWKPIQSANRELDTLKVKKNLPAICILLSKIPLHPSNQGEK